MNEPNKLECYITLSLISLAYLEHSKLRRNISFVNTAPGRDKHSSLVSRLKSDKEKRFIIMSLCSLDHVIIFFHFLLSIKSQFLFVTDTPLK
jgi:hypothetical protein